MKKTTDVFMPQRAAWTKAGRIKPLNEVLVPKVPGEESRQTIDILAHIAPVTVRGGDA